MFKKAIGGIKKHGIGGAFTGAVLKAGDDTSKGLERAGEQLDKVIGGVEKHGVLGAMDGAVRKAVSDTAKELARLDERVNGAAGAPAEEVAPVPAAATVKESRGLVPTLVISEVAIQTEFVAMVHLSASAPMDEDISLSVVVAEDVSDHTKLIKPPEVINKVPTDLELKILLTLFPEPEKTYDLFIDYINRYDTSNSLTPEDRSVIVEYITGRIKLPTSNITRAPVVEEFMNFLNTQYETEVINTDTCAVLSYNTTVSNDILINDAVALGLTGEDMNSQHDE